MFCYFIQLHSESLITRIYCRNRCQNVTKLSEIHVKIVLIHILTFTTQSDASSSSSSFWLVFFFSGSKRR